MEKQFLRRYSLSSYLVGIIFLILFIAVAGLIGISYLSNEKALQDNALSVQRQTENNLFVVFRTKEEGLRIYDESLNNRMEDAFVPFLAEYERAGRDPAYMDLNSVKSAIGPEMELYIIDANATIIYTTYPPEAGLNFTDFAPYFADYLHRIRESDGFFPDRIVSEKGTGAMKKYAYMPTPDHRYVLEIGLSAAIPNISSFRYIDKDLIRNVEIDNPYLVDVRVFETTLRQRDNDTSVEVTDPALKERLAGILANRTTVEFPGSEKGIITRYLFIDLMDEKYGSDVSRIIELTYTDLPIRDALGSSITFYVTLGIIAFISCALLALLVIRNITSPIGMMVGDVNSIARGDLDHPLTPPIGKELLMLEESISSMVYRLKWMIKELRESEEKYRTLVESANSIILQSAPDGTILFINKFGQDFFGYSDNEMIGKTVYETILPPTENGIPTREKFRNYIPHPESFYSIENENRTKDGGSVWISWTNRPLYNDSGEISAILSIGNDITRLMRIEKELQDFNTELEKRVTDRTRQLVDANRNLESFTYSVSHDLRAPLRAISGYSSILLKELDGISDKNRGYLETLRQNAHEMAQLIDDLLNFSRLGRQSLQRETVFPTALVREIIQEFRKEDACLNVEFRVEALPPCQGDPLLIRQVFANLISNAIKFSRVRNIPQVTIGSIIQDDKLVYFVRDNGIGFDMRYKDKIFGVFQRLHKSEEYEGTGVGLAIVQRIIELHGGRIWVESEPEKGTTFYFSCE